MHPDDRKDSCCLEPQEKQRKVPMAKTEIVSDILFWSLLKAEWVVVGLLIACQRFRSIPLIDCRDHPFVPTWALWGEPLSGGQVWPTATAQLRPASLMAGRRLAMMGACTRPDKAFAEEAAWLAHMTVDDLGIREPEQLLIAMDCHFLFLAGLPAHWVIT